MSAIVLFSHPDGAGTLEYDGALIASNDLDAEVTRVEIGPQGMRELAFRLLGLADALDGGHAK